MIDSYNAYLSRSVQALATLKQCQNKIAYFLQVSVLGRIEQIHNRLSPPDSERIRRGRNR